MRIHEPIARLRKFDGATLFSSTTNKTRQKDITSRRLVVMICLGASSLWSNESEGESESY